MTRPTPHIIEWVNFEKEICEAVKNKIENRNFMLNPEHTEVFLKKKYYSKDRGKDIVFDVAVESYCSESKEPSLIWIWECKNYADKKVGIEDVEEFYAKLLQVGICKVKGTMVTRVGFQESAVNYAKSQGIGLVVFQKELETILCFGKGIPPRNRIVFTAPFSLSHAGLISTSHDKGGKDIDIVIHSMLRELKSIQG